MTMILHLNQGENPRFFMQKCCISGHALGWTSRVTTCLLGEGNSLALIWEYLYLCVTLTVRKICNIIATLYIKKFSNFVNRENKN